MATSLLSLRESSLSFVSLYDDSTIVRENLITTIEDMATEGYNLIIIEGAPGVGKSTLLLQFGKIHHSNSFTFYINSSCKLTYTLDFFMEDLGRQLFFHLTGNMADEDMAFNEHQFNSLLTSLMKKHSKKGERYYFVIDGLDQIEKADQNLLLPMINHLPFSTNNFYFVISGDMGRISDLLPPKAKRNSKPLRVTNFSLDEVLRFFQWETDEEKGYARELYTIWRGHPDTLSQIKRIIKNGISIQEFFSTDISEKDDLLEVEWKLTGLSSSTNEDILIKAICILAFSDTIRRIEDLESVLGYQSGSLETLIRPISFLNFRNNEVDFASNSFRGFVQKKLARYKNSTLTSLVDYFMNKNDTNSLINLPHLLHEKKDYSGIVKLLTLSNLTLILNNSQSFGEINRHLNYGYKASTELNKAYEDLFRFSLHRSTVLGIQTSDIRENQLEAYVRLGKFQDAERLITNAVLKEDKLRILVRFLRELKVNTDQVVEERYIDEIKDLLKHCDRTFIKENLIEIALDLAYVSPQLAINTVQDISGQESEKSLEWLLGYIAFISKKGLDGGDDSLNNPTKRDDELDSFVDKFSESIGFSVKNITGDDVIDEVEKANTVNDKIFRIKGWIKEHPDDTNIFKVIEYALNLLIENASQIKPSATTLFEVIQPIENIKEERHLKSLVSQIDNLLVTVNAPSVDKYRVEFAIILAIFQYDETKSAERAFLTMHNMQSISDCGVKLEVQCYSYNLIRKIYQEIPSGRSFLFSVKEIRDEIELTLSVFLLHTAEQYNEVRDVLKNLATVDFVFSISISKRLNIQYRRFQAIRQCIISHTRKPIREWDIAGLETAMKELMPDTIMYATALLGFVSSAFDKVDELGNDDRINFSKLVKLINPVFNDSGRCIMLAKSIVILSGVSPNVCEARISFEKVLKAMKEALYSSWDRIAEPLGKIRSGYMIVSHLAKHDKSLAEEYLSLTELVSHSISIDNYNSLNAYVECVRLCIRVYAGVIDRDKSFGYSKIESAIGQIPSTREQIMLWSDLAVKCYAVGDTTKAEEIVQRFIISVIEKHRSGNDKEYFYFLVRTAAGAIQLTQPETLRQLFQSLTEVQIDEIVTNISFTILSKKSDFEPYSGNITASKVSYQEIVNFIRLLELVGSDNALYQSIHKLTCYVRDNPNDFVREQKGEFMRKLTQLYLGKIPNPTTGIKHDGYVILCKATCYHYNVSIQPNELIKYFDELEREAFKIDNIPDRVFTLCWLAIECVHSNSIVKRKQAELVNRAFDEAQKIECITERMTSYLLLSERSAKISTDFFKERQATIQADLFKLDEKELFPTCRSFIDLAYKCDKHLAQKWVDTLDSDPARSSIAEPAKNRHEQLEMETKVMEDYAFFGRIKDRGRMANIAWNMLGELHAGKRSSRSMDKVLYFLYTSSKIPFFDAIPAFSLFVENAIADDATTREMLHSFYNSTCGNVDLCYALIGSINNKKVNATYNLSDPQDSIMIRPGMRDEGIRFIKKHVKNCESKDIIVIDQYFSERDVRFIKDLSSWLYDAKITILTSLTEAKNLTRSSFIKAWDDISTDALPNMTIIKTWTNGGKSPFHDRWVVFNDKLQGIELGTSINSIGNQISKISFMHQEEENKQIQNTVIIPFVKNKVNTYENMSVKYEIFDI